jgi:Gpi18-like mannosyltransferase
MLASPYALINGSSAGQCDIFYSTFLLATVYMLFLNRAVAALICYGVAISFKLQAIFLSPFLLVFILRRKLPWYWLWLPVGTYALIALPCWLQGRSFENLMQVYWNQFNNRSSGIFGIAGNFYPLLNRHIGSYAQFVKNAGLTITTLTAITFAFVTYRTWRNKHNSIVEYLILATLGVAFTPFLLPKMLDRYFFAAGMLSTAIACLRPRWLLLPIMFQFSSIITTPATQFYYLRHIHSLTGWSWFTRHNIAASLNLFAILFLTWQCYQRIWKKPPAPLHSTSSAVSITA